VGGCDAVVRACTVTHRPWRRRRRGPVFRVQGAGFRVQGPGFRVQGRPRLHRHAPPLLADACFGCQVHGAGPPPERVAGCGDRPCATVQAGACLG